MTTVQYGDMIDTLPTDKSPVAPHEVQLMNNLFKHKTALTNITREFTDSIVIIILVILFGLPVTEQFILRMVPSLANSPYFFLILKAIIIGILFWLIKYFYLSRTPAR